MDGDPAIRWQCMRDLLDAPQAQWKAERALVSTSGWGKQFMSHQNGNGSWPRERWTDTVWTLLTLVDLGFPPESYDFEPSFEQVVGTYMPSGKSVDGLHLAKNMDLCHLGFWLRIGTYFCHGDARLPDLAKLILSLQLSDGGWNCRVRMKPQTIHSSFHTTFNVLEGLRQAWEAGLLPDNIFKEAEARAIEFMLQHQMYRSDKTDKIVSERFLHLTYPSHWHYTVIRGLDYIRKTCYIFDSRLSDPLDWLKSRMRPNGTWVVEKRIPGVTLFDMEAMGKPSRWNTLRALRTQKAHHGCLVADD